MRTETLLVRDLVRGLDAGERAAMRRVAEGAGGAGSTAIPAALRDLLAARFPNVLRLDRLHDDLRFEDPELARLFAEALAEEEDRPPADAEPPARIAAALAQGDADAALQLYLQAGGHFIIHFCGAHATLRILNAFPRVLRESHPVLVLGFAMHALKTGSISRARHLIGQRFGPEALDLAAMLAAPERFPVEVRFFRFLMTMYEDGAITDATRTALFEALGEVPVDDHLQRGSFYNAMLEIHVRRRELDAAAELARRARHHYGCADAHLLGFYIDLYQAILCLMRGAPAAAVEHVDAARGGLALIPFESPADQRVLDLIDAVIRYEQGDMETLVRFLRDAFGQFAYGEIWPTLAEMTIDYGANALARHVALNAARLFLDRWRVQEWRSNRFRLAITLREVSLLQSANRWQEAADLLNAVQSRVNRTWVEGAVDTLIRLSDPSEIAIAMAWLRHLIWAVPDRLLLRDQLDELLRNGHTTERQRITLSVWAAHVARAQRDVSAARALLLRAFEASARLGTVMPLVEDGAMLDRLLKDSRMAGFVLASAEARATLRRVEPFRSKTPEGARRHGLTHQEMRALSLAAEGATNKVVARELGLSEVTVKFHLSNVYRKLGCRRRAEAIATARAFGWVG